MKPTRLRPRDFLACLLSTAYLPEELPPAITSREYSEFCRRNYITVRAQKDQLILLSQSNATIRSSSKRSGLDTMKGAVPDAGPTRRHSQRRHADVPVAAAKLIRLATNYDTYSAPRNVSGRRALAVVHPLAQLGMSLLITERRKEIKAILQKSGTSLYNVSEAASEGRAFAGLDFHRRRRFAAKLHSEKAVILQADISRFFYTAYTHSIPWAVLGKEKAKELLRTD